MVAVTVITVCTTSRAALYTDTTGDEFTGNPHMDITSVEVTNDFASVIFKINLAGDPVAVNWGKYCIGIDTNAATGDISAQGNGWGRKISMNPNGMDYWVGTWVDGGMGINFYAFDGAFWNGVGGGGTSISKTTSNVTITLPLAGLGKAYGESFDFDVYTTGSNADPAIDSLANPAQTVGSWSDFYSSSLVNTYTIVVPPIPSTNNVTFFVNMEEPIMEFETAIGDGLNTNNLGSGPGQEQVFIRGSFNGWASSPDYELIHIGNNLFSNTVKVVQYLGQPVTYKFFSSPLLGYESPVSTCGADRALTITNLNQTAPTVYWSDRKWSDPTVSVTLEVDMSLMRNFGQFDPDAGHSVTLPGSINGWDNTAVTNQPGTGPNTNIYSVTFTRAHYPTNACPNYYKFFIKDNPSVRNGGWEAPISNNAGDRTFAFSALNLTNRYWYNDENPAFTVTSIQKLDDDSAKVTWQSFPARGPITTGGQYAIESLDTLTGAWTTNGVVGSTTSSSTFTNTGLTGTPTRFYRVGLIGL